jgi:hypothetical protein
MIQGLNDVPPVPTSSGISTSILIRGRPTRPDLYTNGGLTIVFYVGPRNLHFDGTIIGYPSFLPAETPPSPTRKRVRERIIQLSKIFNVRDGGRRTMAVSAAGLGRVAVEFKVFNIMLRISDLAVLKHTAKAET